MSLQHSTNIKSYIQLRNGKENRRLIFIYCPRKRAWLFLLQFVLFSCNCFRILLGKVNFIGDRYFQLTVIYILEKV
jgi:hypothetical protein